MALTKVTSSVLDTLTGLTVTAADGVADNDFVATISNQEATDGRSFGLSINAGSTGGDFALNINTHDAGSNLMRLKGSGDCHFPSASAFGIGTDSAATLIHAKAASGDAELRLEAATNSDARVRFGDATDNDLGYIGFNRNSGYMNFSVNNTAGEHMRIQSGGGISFNGDTAAANALDDYEEGTFTPTFASTNSTATGSYTKIGNQVTVHVKVVSSGGLPSGASQVQIGNLPFTSASGFAGSGGLYIGPSNVSSAVGGGGAIVPFISGGETVIRLVVVDTGTLGYLLWGETEVSHNNVVTAIATVTYQV